MAFVTSGLSAYVNTNLEPLIKDMVLGIEDKNVTIPYLTKQVGIKTTERLNYLSVSPVLQSAATCGFSAQGETVFSERDLQTSQFKTNSEWCLETLLGSFAEYQVRIGADPQALPWEANIMNEYIKGINRQMETQVWLGDTANTGRTDLINGFITLAKGADSGSTITGETSGNAYTAVMKALELIPEEILDDEDTRIFCSPAIFREYCMNLVSLNLYHYEGELDSKDEMFIPASNVKLKKVAALAGSPYLYASTYKNMVYGCDMVDNKEELKVWFSDDYDVYRAKARWNAGVMTYFPDMVVLVEKQ